MYEIPKDDNIGRVTITGDYIRGTGGPLIDIRQNGHTLEEIDQLNKVSDAGQIEEKTTEAQSE